MEKELRELHEKLDYIIETLKEILKDKQKQVRIVNQVNPDLLEEYLKSNAGESILNRILKKLGVK